MVKSEARPRPTKTCFLLRGSPHLYLKTDVLVKFKPLRKRYPFAPCSKTLPNTSIVPTFNHDRKPYTLAFRIPSADPDDDQVLADYHKARIAEAQLEITEIVTPPLPSSTPSPAAKTSTAQSARPITRTTRNTSRTKTTAKTSANPLITT